MPNVSSHTPTRSGLFKDPVFLAVLVCFFLSGFSALLYETAWMRMFAAVFGTAEFAIAAVLASYMAGLAIGAAISGKLLAKIVRPVLIYAFLEAGIAITAFLVPWGINAARSIQVVMLGGQAEPPSNGGITLALFYLTVAFCLILIPTTFMGATLPILARHVIQRADQIGRRIGLLYAVNTFGAVAGTLVAAFVLIGKTDLGLQGTICVGVAINGVVCVIAVWLARHPVAHIASDTMPPRPLSSTLAESQQLAYPTTFNWVSVPVLILPMMFFSAIASFVYEVTWTRLLGHILGASVFAFATMLASFLTGIAIGSTIASKYAQSFKAAAVGFVVSQFGTGVASMLIYWSLDVVAEFALREGQTDLLTNVLLAIAVLLPATIFIGATFPFAVRILARDSVDAGPVSARVYAWNTSGAIVGALCASFVLLPNLGYANCMLVIVGLNFLLGVIGCWLIPEVAAKSCAVCLSAAALLLVVFQPSPPENVLRINALTRKSVAGEVLYSQVGFSSDVIVVDDGEFLQLLTNGLPEAPVAPQGTPPPYGMEGRYLTALPILLRPEAKSVLVIGLGGGIAVEEVPQSVEEIDVVEIEDAVITANRIIAQRRKKDPLLDPRIQLIVNDARSALALTDKKWDVIVSQPSHPWTAGASHLYTQEFAATVRDRLVADGVFLQWVGPGDDQLLLSTAATLQSVFDNVELYQPTPTLRVFLASCGPLLTTSGSRHLAQVVELLDDAPDEFAQLGFHAAEDLIAVLSLDATTVHELCRGVPINTDNRNRLVSTSWGVSNAADARKVGMLLGGSDPLVDPKQRAELLKSAPFDFAYLLQRIVARGQLERARVVVAKDPEPHYLAVGVVQQTLGNRPAADQAFRAALEANPENWEAQFRLFESALSNSTDPGQAGRLTAAGELLAEPAASVVLAAEKLFAQQWNKVFELEDRIADIPADHPCFSLASQIRIAARLAAPERLTSEMRKETLQLVDHSLSLNISISGYLNRIDAAYAAGEVADILHTARFLLRRLPGTVSLEARQMMPVLQRVLGRVSQVAHEFDVDPTMLKRVEAVEELYQRRLQDLNSPGVH